MSSPIVVFDLDGTLVDTAPDLVASLNHVVAQAGLEPVTYGDLTHLVGHGARAMIERTFALRQRPLDDALLDRQLKDFVDFYHGTMPGDSLPYPGLVAALDRLSDAGFTLAVCTNKPEGLARRLLERLGLIDRFAAISGGDTFEIRKPNADHLLRTIANAGGAAERSVMVGDSLNDMLVARNASVPSIAVPFGYSDVPVERLEPTVIIQHFDELTPTLVTGLFEPK
ncbi:MULTISPECIES: HAD family hydrolase [unclassified Ensifer]|uniref:HAD family hydrolase n=1 Tax=unclassified Ensifer TaxID=2633371 RepID=UPI00081394E2|nr:MULTISPECIES: HAD family hydrolase [unclassified Ensifer]OCP10258.1 phosphoglycolate phosphatase, bacterial [Ensifer sp. LC13]OCP11254.1 phosphoglycolate phosphatase, bacterial [Ensifer sp. LC11]OCP14672.1 phosphoglycolate phosphatase, bacterial [Ensifer sp. LC14]OCP33216.1 phosphoglycolate phosphatase, bacterial [Ensifer sp. LC499]